MIKKINQIEGTGQVKMAGQIRPAVPAEDNEIEPGTQVRCNAITGVKLVVIKIDTREHARVKET